MRFFFTSQAKPKNRLESIDQISSMIRKSNDDAHLELQNLLKSTILQNPAKITKSDFRRIRSNLSAMAENDNWKYNAIQFLVPIIHKCVIETGKSKDDIKTIYPILTPKGSSFAIGLKSSNWSILTKVILYIFDDSSDFVDSLTLHLNDKTYFSVYSEAVSQLAKTICESPRMVFKYF